MFLNTLVIFICFLCIVNALNVTTISPSGYECNLDSNGKSTHCVKTSKFDEKIQGYLKKGMEMLSNNIKKVQGGDVCSSVSPYMPSLCSCVDNAGGANVDCVADIKGIDTIEMKISMQVCANPATIGITLIDGDTGLTFSASLTSGDTGSLPTGIMLGVPDVGEAEIVLVYTIMGNIDNLEVILGFDLQITTMGIVNTCSYWYPSECPLIFFDETINFGSYC